MNQLSNIFGDPLEQIDKLIYDAHVINKKLEFRQKNAVWIDVKYEPEFHTEWTFVTQDDKKVMAPF